MAETRDSFRMASAGVLTVGNGKDRWEAPFNGEIVGVAPVVGTAPVGAAIILGIKKNGVATYSGNPARPTIPDGATESTVEPAAKPDLDAKFAAGDTITLDILQVGSGTAGSDLEVTVETVAT